MHLKVFSCVSVLQVCGGGVLDSRAEQCAAFNTQEFMGRLYNWEPFSEGEYWVNTHMVVYGLAAQCFNVIIGLLRKLNARRGKEGGGVKKRQ